MTSGGTIEWLTSEAPVPYPEALAFMEAHAAAIAEGATHVRVGTAIFGHRPAA